MRDLPPVRSPNTFILIDNNESKYPTLGMSIGCDSRVSQSPWNLDLCSFFPFVSLFSLILQSYDVILME